MAPVNEKLQYEYFLQYKKSYSFYSKKNRKKYHTFVRMKMLMKPKYNGFDDVHDTHLLKVTDNIS